MCNIPIEVIANARDSLDAVLYWAEDGEKIPNETYKEALEALNRLEEYIPFPEPLKEIILVTDSYTRHA